MSDGEAVERLGAYRLEKILGRGGMGEVWLAWDERLHRRVALKRLRDGGPEKLRYRERFLREARAAARLNHPAIVQIYDILEREDGGCEAIVMEWIEGRTLAQRLIDDGALPVAEALELAAEIADGLQEAHDKDLVHRDLKGANVLLTASGRPKILDFGLARAFQDDAGSSDSIEAVAESLTESGMILGTIHAMAPEQVRGLPVDHRADLFALGVLLYEMLAARTPFRAGSTLATLYRIVQEPAPALIFDRPDLPIEIERFVVDELLAKAPDDRPASAAAVAEKLRRWNVEHERPTEERPATDSTRSTAVGALPESSRLDGHESPTLDMPSPISGTIPRRRKTVGIVAALAVVAAGVWFSLPQSQSELRIDAPVFLEVEPAVGDDWRARAVADVLAAQWGDARIAETSSDVETLRVASRPADDRFEITICRGEICTDPRAVADDEWLAFAARTADALLPDADGSSRDRPPLEAPTRDALEQGYRFLILEDPTSALRRFDDAAGRAADRPEPLIGRAVALDQLGRRKEAQTAAESAVQSPGASIFQSVEAQSIVLELQFGPPRVAALATAIHHAAPKSDAELQYFVHELRRAEIQSRVGLHDLARETLSRLRPVDDAQRAAAALKACDLAYLAGRGDDHLHSARRAKEIGVSIEASLVVARALQREGMALRSLGRLPEALQALQESERIYSEQGAAHGAAGSTVEIGVIYGRQGKMPEAASAFERAVRHYAEAGDHLMEARMKANRALILRELGELHAAEQIHREVYERMAEQGDPGAAAVSRVNHVLILEELGRAQEALDLHRKALDELSTTSHGERLRPWALEVLGFLQTRTGDFSTASRTLAEAAAAAENAGDALIVVRTQIHGAEIDRLSGDLDRAAQRLRDAKETAETSDARIETALILRQTGLVELERGAAEAARAALDESSRIFQRIGKPHEIAWTRVASARALRLAGESSRARAELDAAVTYFRGEKLDLWLARASLESARLHSDQGRCDAAKQDLTSAGESLQDALPIVDVPRRLTEGAVLGACGEAETARTILGEALITASKSGFRLWDLEIRLERARLDLDAGNRDAARPALELVRANAADLGLRRLERRAEELLAL